MTAARRRSCGGGFTLFEVMVAVGLSSLVAGVVLFLFARTEDVRRIYSKKLRFESEWHAFVSLFERDFTGTYDFSGDDFGSGADAFSVSPGGHRVEFVTATENSGPADFVKVAYYLVRNPSDPSLDGLYRKVWYPGDPEPPDGTMWRAFPDVKGFTVSPETSGPPPARLSVVMTFSDPMDPETGVLRKEMTFEAEAGTP